MQNVRDDLLIVGRGMAREVYAFDKVRHTDVEIRQPVDETGQTVAGPPVFLRAGLPVTPDGFEDDDPGRPFVETIQNERTETRYVFWPDVRISPARCWSEVWWVAYRHAMDKDELEREFGADVAKAVPKILAADTGETKSSDRGRTSEEMPADPESPFNRAEVWEVWNKLKRERIWIATSYEQHILRKDPDPLRLKGFFPMPAPPYAVPTTDSMVPVPELVIYEPLADELDELQDRTRQLTKAAKNLVFADGDVVEIHDISNSPDNEIIPINRPEVFAEDLSRAFWTWPIERIVTAIQLLSQRSEQLKQAIYELTGISDLRRGVGKERESATAQRLKASYGAQRMTPRSQPMAEYVRDLLRIKAEIMAEHFDPATLEQISGSAVPPAVLDLLRTERFRHTTIDVETDSTVAPDAEADKAESVEFVTAIGTYLRDALPVAQAAPEMVPLLMSLLRAAVRPFKFSREIEAQLDDAAEALEAAAQQRAQQAQVGAPGVPVPGVPAAPVAPQLGVVQ